MSHPIHSSTLKPAIINAANPSQSLRVVSTGTPYSMGLASMGHAIPACMLEHKGCRCHDAGQGTGAMGCLADAGFAATRMRKSRKASRGIDRPLPRVP
jgi:hypothetical protein